MNNSRLVYSSGSGRVCPSCGSPVSACGCKKKPSAPLADGVVRIRREVKGRGGKTVTVASGFQLGESELKSLATDLKRRCGTGGSIKDGDILIQGDHRETLLAELKKKGYLAKLAGG